MMTAMDNPGAERVAFVQGVIAFFAKPFDDAAFLEAVLRALPASIEYLTTPTDSPKSDNAQPSGSYSGGSFNQAVKGSIKIFSASARLVHSNSSMALNIGY
jgi:hypothetical protein